MFGSQTGDVNQIALRLKDMKENAIYLKKNNSITQNTKAQCSEGMATHGDGDHWFSSLSVFLKSMYENSRHMITHVPAFPSPHMDLYLVYTAGQMAASSYISIPGSPEPSLISSSAVQLFITVVWMRRACAELKACSARSRRFPEEPTSHNISSPLGKPNENKAL